MNKKILIVEDESGLREALTDAFADAGYEVLTADNGQAGLEMAKNERPAVLVLDLRMPLMNGFQMLSSLRSSKEGQGMKVVVLTAVDDEASRSMVQEYNPDGYLVKTDTSLKDAVALVAGLLAGQG